MKTKPFDLEEAKAGKPVVTGGGLPVRIICTDRVCASNSAQKPVIGLITLPSGHEDVRMYDSNGQQFTNPSSPVDLRMIVEEQTLNVIIFSYDYAGKRRYGSMVNIDAEKFRKDHPTLTVESEVQVGVAV